MDCTCRCGRGKPIPGETEQHLADKSYPKDSCGICGKFRCDTYPEMCKE